MCYGQYHHGWYVCQLLNMDYRYICTVNFIEGPHAVADVAAVHTVRRNTWYQPLGMLSVHQRGRGPGPVGLRGEQRVMYLAWHTRGLGLGRG